MQGLLAHQPADFLAIDDQTPMAQGGSDPAIAIGLELVADRPDLQYNCGIVGFHWRGAPDEAAALAAVDAIEAQARTAGFEPHRGRKVLEVRPPVPIDKGRGVRWVLGEAQPAAALYVGDDLTDIDAFAGVRQVAGEAAVCIGVRSEETPAELEQAADAMVEGTRGVGELLEALLR